MNRIIIPFSHILRCMLEYNISSAAHHACQPKLCSAQLTYRRVIGALACVGVQVEALIGLNVVAHSRI